MVFAEERGGGGRITQRFGNGQERKPKQNTSVSASGGAPQNHARKKLNRIEGQIKIRKKNLGTEGKKRLRRLKGEKKGIKKMIKLLLDSRVFAFKNHVQ